MEALFTADALTTLLTLSVLEIVLGVDNLVMIAILVSALDKDHQNIARRLGIAFALITRVILLSMMSWLASLTEPLFHIGAHAVSVRDLVLFLGGVVLFYKGSKELFEMRHPDEHREEARAGSNSVVKVALTIGLFDIVFSLDSVITAIGMSNQLPIMITAVCLAMAVMLFASGPVIRVINAFMQIKVLALCFLLLIGVMLVCNGSGAHIPKGYIYAGMGFSALTQVCLIRLMNAHKQTKMIVLAFSILLVSAVMLLLHAPVGYILVGIGFAAFTQVCEIWIATSRRKFEENNK
ncbi:MAG: TerC family protein [Deferribacteraceae bacterium]|jgi:predicted tellurium resistance membrane protein TerC|nr:TerC family protein [Deferribacteraceae bacterium]